MGDKDLEKKCGGARLTSSTSQRAHEAKAAAAAATEERFRLTVEKRKANKAAEEEAAVAGAAAPPPSLPGAFPSLPGSLGAPFSGGGPPLVSAAQDVALHQILEDASKLSITGSAQAPSASTLRGPAPAPPSLPAHPISAGPEYDPEGNPPPLESLASHRQSSRLAAAAAKLAAANDAARFVADAKLAAAKHNAKPAAKPAAKPLTGKHGRSSAPPSASSSAHPSPALKGARITPDPSALPSSPLVYFPSPGASVSDMSPEVLKALTLFYSNTLVPGNSVPVPPLGEQPPFTPGDTFEGMKAAHPEFAALLEPLIAPMHTGVTDATNAHCVEDYLDKMSQTQDLCVCAVCGVPTQRSSNSSFFFPSCRSFFPFFLLLFTCIQCIRMGRPWRLPGYLAPPAARLHALKPKCPNSMYSNRVSLNSFV